MQPYSGAKMYMMETFSMPFGRSTDLETRFMLIADNFRDSDFETCRIPMHLVKLAKLYRAHRTNLYGYTFIPNVDKLKLLYDFRVFNEADTIYKCVGALKFAYESTRPVERHIERDIEKVLAVDAGKIAEQCENGVEIKEKLFQARLAALSN